MSFIVWFFISIASIWKEEVIENSFTCFWFASQSFCKKQGCWTFHHFRGFFWYYLRWSGFSSFFFIENVLLQESLKFSLGKCEYTKQDLLILVGFLIYNWKVVVKLRIFLSHFSTTVLLSSWIASLCLFK